jgi:UDP-N-acetylglucosamine diphosphorylase/glucosamine-1-phosphate N-acetyltransferase
VSEPLLYVFDDHRARRWAPFTLTRPVGELLYGCMSLRERAERVTGLRCAGYLSRPALEGFDEPDATPVVRHADIPEDRTRVLLLSRAVLAFQEFPELTGSARLTVEGMPVGWVLAPGDPLPPDQLLRFPPNVEDAEVALEGMVLGFPWHLVAGTPSRIASDVRALFPHDDGAPGVVRIGSDVLSVAPGAELEPGVVVDTRGGPVRLERGAQIEGPTRLVGPLHVGRDTKVLGGTIGTSALGPACKVRGEVVDSVLLGYVNKAHEGYLGHAVIGRWVNLGAGTCNSDLKNNYSPVRVWTLDGERDTGMLKVGCFMGDHVKTGIGTMLNTGTVVGAASNVFGAQMPPPVVPPFSWGSGTDLRDYRFDRFLESAERSMARRDRQLTPGMRGILNRAWQETRVRRVV